MISTNEFTNLIQKQNNNEQNFRMATVTAVSSGQPYLTFYGETTQRSKVYKRLSSYSPTVNDTVVCVKINGTYLILGKAV